MSKVQLVFAVGYLQNESHAFGYNGELPWGHCKEDLKNFKEVTDGTILLMGRYTFNSLPKKLPGRMHVVLSTTPARIATRMEQQRPDMQINGGSLSVALDVLKADYPGQTISIIGGKAMIEEALQNNLSDEIHVTFMRPKHGARIPFDIEIERSLVSLSRLRKAGYKREVNKDTVLTDHHLLNGFMCEVWKTQ